MKKTIYSLLLAGCMPLAVFAQDSTQFIKASWKDLLVKAKKEHKPIFVDTYFEGCHACKDMEMRVFPVKEVKEYMQENFINTGFDVFKEDFGFDLCARYMLHGFPTYLIISPEGKLVDMDLGYSDYDKFLAFLKQASSRYKNGQFHDGFATNVKKDGPDWYQAMFSKNRIVPKDSVLLPFLAAQKNKMSEMAGKAMAIARNLPADYRAYYLANRKQYQDKFGKDINSAILSNIINADLKELPKSFDQAAFDAFIKKHEAEYAGADWQAIKMQFASGYFMRNKLYNEYLDYVIANNNMNDNDVRVFAFNAGQELYKNPELAAKYTKWGMKAMNQHCSMEVLTGMSRFAEKADHKAEAKQYMNWAAEKAEAMGMTDAATSYRSAAEKM
ncbi:thioredoxin fold domain-containing protein [Chitinophaga sp. Cy-1792]|uniref:thioredoxin family protein n=1 Tax=Chitinophaga sp. Cy-1792 TaxID=2608339 RepID=UPI0014232DD2|nr:thioredoxin fold domain-containing protein [Chitinophaga sp. Cy-1792]NIG53466.1 thioredoxin family protein [Chitinophaga sp. Cy-1792]